MKVNSKKYLSPADRETRKFQMALLRYFIWILLAFSIVFLAAVYRPHN